MRCAVTLSNITNRAPMSYPTTRQWYPDTLSAGGDYLAQGRYTLSAALAPEQGKTIMCYAALYDDWDDYEHHTYVPASGEASLPFAFDVGSFTHARFFFGYEGFRGADGDPIDPSAVTNVKIAEAGKPENDTYDTVALAPEEIADSDVMAQAINSKSSVVLRVLPGFEAFGFAVRGLTIVRIYDLDLPLNRCIFKGRVSAVSDIMDASGVISQELTCVSAADFLEDTAFSDNIGSQSLANWLGKVCASHNASVEPARRFTFTVTGSANVGSGSDYICKSDYGVITDVLTGGRYLTASGSEAAWEWRERYQNDVFYLDIAAKLGEDKDTAIVIGENLKNIRVERMTDGGIYTTVRAVSGINADGYRYDLTAANAEMYAKYGAGHELVVTNDDIYFTGAGGREYLPNGTYTWHLTPAVIAMQNAMKAYAAQEAAKLSDPPITITLAAADLAAMGYTGYERFEIGNSYPVVCPPVGLYGQKLRVTGIRRRLSDGRIEQITIAKGAAVGGAGGSLSAQMARLSAANTAATDDSKMIDIISETTGGLYFDPLTQAEFDDLSEKDDNTIYYVDDDGDISIYKGDTHISTGGGGGGTIETAAVLSSEQMTYWAPDHQLVPVEFRGGAHIYYSQPPAKIVIQKQHGIVGTPTADLVAISDLYTEIAFEFSQAASSGKQKLKFEISKMQKTRSGDTDFYVFNATVVCSQVDGSTEVIIGSYDLSQFGVPANSTEWGLGLLISVSQLTGSPPNPECTVYAVCKNGQNLVTLGTPSISGSFLNPGFTAEFLNDAERNFALGVAGIVEPSSGGAGE